MGQASLVKWTSPANPAGAKKKKKHTLEGVWVPEKAGLLSKKAWLQS